MNCRARHALHSTGMKRQTHRDGQKKKSGKSMILPKRSNRASNRQKQCGARGFAERGTSTQGRLILAFGENRRKKRDLWRRIARYACMNCPTGIERQFNSLSVAKIHGVSQFMSRRKQICRWHICRWDWKNTRVFFSQRKSLIFYIKSAKLSFHLIFDKGKNLRI